MIGKDSGRNLSTSCVVFIHPPPLKESRKKTKQGKRKKEGPYRCVCLKMIESK